MWMSIFPTCFIHIRVKLEPSFQTTFTIPPTFIKMRTHCDFVEGLCYNPNVGEWTKSLSEACCLVRSKDNSMIIIQYRLITSSKGGTKHTVESREQGDRVIAPKMIRCLAEPHIVYLLENLLRYLVEGPWILK